MKSHSLVEVRYKERPTFRAGESASDGASSGEADEPVSRDTTQAERAVMHPEHQDLEWRYCRGGLSG